MSPMLSLDRWKNFEDPSEMSYMAADAVPSRLVESSDVHPSSSTQDSTRETNAVIVEYMASPTVEIKLAKQLRGASIDDTKPAGADYDLYDSVALSPSKCYSPSHSCTGRRKRSC